ncbi:MAG TPA: HNH endonuclease family protein [Bryobacteraceae bacterium]|nr:HNH endonuclease family protein [Bryobacteraceae bacterium]
MPAPSGPGAKIGRPRPSTTATPRKFPLHSHSAFKPFARYSDRLLEHVLPQRPGNGWKHVSAEEAKANYNRLGNQALLSGDSNSRLNNAEFKDKKSALAASPFSLTKSISKIKDGWGVIEIAARQKELARFAVAAWPLSV